MKRSIYAPILMALAIIAACVWVYWPCLQGDWLWDDDILITENANLRSWSGLWNIWFSPSQTDYWPLTWTCLWMQWQLWGNNPLPYHLFSLALHIASALLVWRILAKLGLSAGWWGGLLFAIHPLAVESVAWISEIKNTLSLPFVLLSFDAFIDADEKKKGYWHSIIFYLIGMLCKTSSVMFPLTLLLYCWWRHGKVSGYDFLRVFPFGAVAIVLGLVTIHFQNQHISIVPIAQPGIVGHIVIACIALLFYLGKFLVPIHLLPVYPLWAVDSVWLEWIVGMGFLTVLIGALWNIRRTERGRALIFGAGFFALNLFPVLGFFRMTYSNLSWVADHFAYLPMIGLVGLAALGIDALCRTVPPRFHAALTVSVAAVAVLLAVESHSYSARFKDQFKLWTYTLKHNPQAWTAYYHLGNICFGQSGGMDQAIADYRMAIALNPFYAEAHNNLGYALATTGHLQEAISEYMIALQLAPQYASAHDNLGSVYLHSPKEAIQDNVAKAISEYQTAIQLEPNNWAAYYNLGLAELRMGDRAQAVSHIEKAMAINPNFSEGRQTLYFLETH